MSAEATDPTTDAHLVEASGGNVTGDTMVAMCPLCRSDLVEPVAVGGLFDGSDRSDAYLVTECGRCACRYVNPPPTGARGVAREHQTTRVPESLLRRWTIGLGAGARILEVEHGSGHNIAALQRLGGAQWHFDAISDHSSHQLLGNDAAAQDGAHTNVQDPYDLILLNHALERATLPPRLLQGSVKLLRPNGRVVVLVNNVRSPSFTAFGGRHWAGFQFPHHRQVFALRTIHHLARHADLRIRDAATIADPSTWDTSLRHLARDWQRLPSPPTSRGGARALATTSWTLEQVGQLMNRGAVLAVVLEQS